MRKATVGLLGAVVVAAVTLTATRHPAGADSWKLDHVRFEPVLPDAPQPPGNPANWLTADGVGSYRGALVVTRDGPNVAVINDVGFDDYLLGLSEMPRTWPLPALEAQVVAARTYALWNVLAKPPSPWAAAGAQICASDACQVYRGLGAEQARGSNVWAAAVGATSGQVLLWRNLVLFPAYGSSDGGQTVSGGVPWLPAVADPDDAISPLHHWQWTAPLAALEGPLGIAAPNHLTDLRVENGQFVVVITHSDGSSSSAGMDAGAFYAALNSKLPPPAGLPRPLPSRRYTVSTESGQVSFDGSGYGNLLGLSQYGALGKALKGNSASDILASYYGGARPTALAPSQLPPTLRVEVASGTRQVSLWAPGALRVLDGSGKQLALTSGGAWTVTADRSGGVHVDPSGAVAEPAKLAGPPAPTGDAPIPTAPNPPVSTVPTLPPLKPAPIGPLRAATGLAAHRASSPTPWLAGATVILVLTAVAASAAGVAWRRRRDASFSSVS